VCFPKNVTEVRPINTPGALRTRGENRLRADCEVYVGTYVDLTRNRLVGLSREISSGENE
jgi:hypothetical protein